MPSLDDEVTYISGIASSGILAQIANSAWDGNNPATYSPPYNHAAKWQPTASANLAGTPGGTISYYFDPASNWNTTEKQDFIAGLALWSAVSNISFTQTGSASAAQITITRGSDGQAHTATNYAGTSDAGLIGGSKLLQITSATISIDTSVAGFGPITGSFTAYGGYPWEAILHEEGHALGLNHAGPYPVTSVSNPSTLQFSPYDVRQWTIMSYIEPSDTTAPYYSQYPVTGTNWGLSPPTNGKIYHNEATTLMAADILAIQRIYGLPTSTPLSGGQVFGFNSNITGAIAPFFDFSININPVVTLWDMGTNNTLDLTGFSTASNVNLNPGTFSSCDGLINNVCIAFNTAIDRLYAGAGNDIILGNNNGDYLSGGAGNDTITGGAGSDTLVGGTGSNTLDGGSGINTAVYSGLYSTYAVTIDTVTGRDTVSGNGVSDSLTNISFLQFADTTIPTVQNLVLTGGPGNDTLTGGDGDDVLRGGDGTNILDGRGGNDKAAFSLSPGNYYVTANANGYLVRGPGETDTLLNIEQASFDGTGQTLSLSQFVAQSFNPLRYVASYSDLIGVFGLNQEAAANHYVSQGYYEGRTASFDALDYTASYGDLIRAFGLNQNAALTHYIQNGYAEGRRASFNALAYTASYGDLINAFGTNQSAALTHYIQNGYAEGRTVSFNALAYTASYGDLIQAFGLNQNAALNHYISQGFQEGRTASFNALAYTASYGDLIRAFGTNQNAALTHYIQNGYAEGRTVSFDPMAYLLTNTDLQTAGFTAQTAAIHYIQNGYSEGRSTSGAFGTEQTQHILTLGTQAASSITSGDKDWFSIDLIAGHAYDFSLSGLSGGVTGGLSDPFLELHDAHGILVTQDNDSGPGTDALIHFSATATGTYYLVAASNIPGATGNYKILAANG